MDDLIAGFGNGDVRKMKRKEVSEKNVKEGKTEDGKKRRTKVRYFRPTCDKVSLPLTQLASVFINVMLLFRHR